MPEVQLAFEQAMSRAGEPGVVGQVNRTESWRYVTSRRMSLRTNSLTGTGATIGTATDGPFAFVAVNADGEFKIAIDGNVGNSITCNKVFAAFINTTVTVKIANVSSNSEQNLDIIIAGRGTNPA
jgi:hypothetical protein